MDEWSIRTVADSCNRRGHQGWVRRHLRTYLAEDHRAVVCPTDSDIERELDEFARDEDRSFGLRYWAEEGAGHLIPPGRLMAILRRWLASKCDPRACLVAAEIIASVGTRSDLGMLDACSLTGTAEGRLTIGNARYRVERRSLR